MGSSFGGSRSTFVFGAKVFSALALCSRGEVGSDIFDTRDILYEVLLVLVEGIDRGLEGLASYQKQDKRRLVTEARSGAPGKYLYVDPFVSIYES